MKLYHRIEMELEVVWSAERGRMMKEFIKQRRTKRKESEMITMIKEEVKLAILKHYMRLCRRRWSKMFKSWFRKEEGEE